MYTNDVCDACNKEVEGTTNIHQWLQKYDDLFKNITSSLTNIYVNIILSPDLSYVHEAQ